MSLRALLPCLVIALSASAAGAALALDRPGGDAMPSGPGAAPALQLADVTPPPDDAEPLAAGVATPVDGRWRIGADMVLELKAGEYQLYIQGQAEEHGTFRLDGDALVSRSDEGREDRGRVTREGDLVLIEPEEGAAILLRAEVPSGTSSSSGQAGGAASVEGRWRTVDGGTIELAGGQAVFRGAADAEPEMGHYRIEGDNLVVVGEDGAELRGPWATIGGRLVIDAGMPHGAIVLSPDGGATADDGATAGTTMPPEAPSAIDGRWVLFPGLVVEFAGTGYVGYEDGEVDERGTFSLDGDRITLKDEDGDVHAGRFTRAGDLLLLEPDEGEGPMLLRAETPGAPPPPLDPAALVGGWSTSEAAVIELTADGRYRVHEDGEVDEGTYRVEGDVLVLNEGTAGNEMRVRAAVLGERIVLEPDGREDAIVLTPAPVPTPAESASEPSQALGEMTVAEATVLEPPAADQPAADQPAADQPATDQPVPVASDVDGRWLMADGLALEFAAGRYTVTQKGEVRVNGTYTIEGDTLLLHRDTDAADAIRRSRVTRAGDVMLIEPEDDTPALLFAEAPSGTAPVPAPEDVEGRWRTNEGELVELRAGRYIVFGDDGSVASEGSYTVDGAAITLQLPGRTETGRWVRLGGRVAVQLTDEDEAIVLTPEPLVDTGQLPQQPADDAGGVAGTTPEQTPAPEPAEQPAAPTGQAEPTPESPAMPTPEPTQPADAGQPPALPAEPAQPQSAPPPLPGVQLSDGTPLGEQWAGYLKGKRMVQGVGQMVLQLLDLCSDGRYVWLVGQGVETPRQHGTGSWSVLTQGQLASLQLTPAGAAPGLLQLDFDGRTAYLNRTPTEVLAMNQSCQ